MAKKQPCVSCGTMVPEHTVYPYDECPPDCELSARWRKELNELEDNLVLKAAAAFREGVNARIDGKDETANPYPFVGDQCDDECCNWQNGWEWQDQRERCLAVLGHYVALYEYDNGSLDISMQSEVYQMAVKVLPPKHLERAIADPDAFLLTAEELLGSEQEKDTR